MNNNNYCSIDKKDNYNKYKTCFDKDTLMRIADTWNRFNTNNKINYSKGITHKKLWNLIDKKFKEHKMCTDEICWAEQLNLINDDTIKDSLLPEKPTEWNLNPRTWLSNYDIDNVMYQYEKSKDYDGFKFLGVYPVDFRSTEYTGTCLYKEICALDIKQLYDSGITNIGMIINLDKHDQPGSHWVALFTCIDPKEKYFGTYYYDSNGIEPPKLVYTFMEELRNQAYNVFGIPKKKNIFNLRYNKKRHQFKNSECGMFSMVFLIRWLNYINRYKKEEINNVTFDDIVGLDINDEDVFNLRKEFFRPNYHHNNYNNYNMEKY